MHVHDLAPTITSSDEEYDAELTDFGPGRLNLFGNSTDEPVTVHDRGASQADVTGG